MRIANYNRHPSKICFEDDALILFPHVLLGEELLLASTLSNELKVNENLDDLSEEFIIQRSLYVYSDNDHYVNSVKNHSSNRKLFNQLKAKKGKTKRDLEFIGKHMTSEKVIRENLKKYYARWFNDLKIASLLELIKEGYFHINYQPRSATEKHQDRFINILELNFREKEFIHSLDSIVENLLTYKEIDDNNCEFNDFVKIPLWNFPLFDGITTQEMKYSRNDLQPSMLPFYNNFQELSKSLYTLDYNPKNLQEIKQLFNDKLGKHIAPVQQAIDNSLFLSKMRNQNPINTGMRFHLGITSAENLVNYYEKTEIILPYVATETKEKLSRFMNLQSCHLFCYVLIDQPEMNQEQVFSFST